MPFGAHEGDAPLAEERPLGDSREHDTLAAGVALCWPGQRALAVAIVLAATAHAALAQEPPIAPEKRRCLNCPGQSRIARISQEERAGMVAAPAREPGTDLQASHFRQGRLVRSGHAHLGCVDCHAGSGDLPHPMWVAVPGDLSNCVGYRRCGWASGYPGELPTAADRSSGWAVLGAPSFLTNAGKPGGATRIRV